MTEYMRSVFAISAVIAVLSLFFYKEKKDFSVTLAFSVLVVYSALMPVISVMSKSEWDGTFELEFDGGEYSEDYLTVAEEAFCDGIERLVTEKYGLNSEGVFVLSSGFDFEKMQAERIRIILSGSAALGDCKGIEKYINELGIGRCSVEIEIG